MGEWTGVHFQALCALLKESLALNRELGDQEAIARVRMCLASGVCHRGAYHEGLALFEESLALQRALGNTRGIAFCLMESAWRLVAAQGDQTTVRARLEERLMLWRVLGSESWMARHALDSAWIAFYQGDLVTAQALFPTHSFDGLDKLE